MNFICCICKWFPNILHCVLGNTKSSLFQFFYIHLKNNNLFFLLNISELYILFPKTQFNICRCSCRSVFLQFGIACFLSRYYCREQFLSPPSYPLDLLTCHPQVHLPAFRRPNHPHFNLSLALVFTLEGTWMGGPLCSRTGCNAWEMVDGAGAMATHRHGERKAPIWKWLLWRCVCWVFVMYPLSHRWPTGYWLNRNWTQKPIIALCWCVVWSNALYWVWGL